MTAVFQKNPESPQQPASTTKVVNALVFNDWVAGALLDATVEVSGADTVNWSTNSNAGLLSGDVISYRDLLYGSMVPSGNDAAKCIARHVGTLIIAGAGPGGSSDPVTRFVEAMGAKAAELGMATATFGDPFGADLANQMSASDLATAMVALSGHPLLVTVAGTMSRGLTITGPNARTQTVTHTVQANIAPAGPVPMPEFIAGKTGTMFYGGGNSQHDSGGCLVVLWEAPSGSRRVTVVLGSELPDPIRYRDVRKLIDYELARLGDL